MKQYRTLLLGALALAGLAACDFVRFPGDGGFDSLAASAEDYAGYLNAHPAFAEFRAERADLRTSAEPITGPELVDEIAPYADDPAYVDQLRAVMTGPDELDQFDPVAEGED